MKKIIFFILCCLFIIVNVFASEDDIIYIGNKIPNMYIRKIDSNGKITNKQGGFIRRKSDNTFVYCLEPFVSLINNYTYQSIDNEYWEYLDINEETWSEVSLIAYYGYMYGDHQEDYWYYVTQMLIWRTIDENAKFYFLDSLNGNINDNLYIDEILEIQELIKKHKQKPDINDLTIMYGDRLSVYDNSHMLNQYNILNNYGIVNIQDNYLNIDANVIGNYNINIYKENNYYLSIPIIYVDEKSQKILKVGDVEKDYYNFSINIIPGEIKIIKKDYDSNENINISGIKFILYDEKHNIISESFTNDEGIAVFNNIKMGKYYIKEVSNQIIPGYEISDDVIKIIVNNTESQNVYFYNRRCKGKIKIVKYLEIFDTNFSYIKGKNIEFELYDNNNNLLTVKSTDVNGEIIFDNLIPGVYIIKEKNLTDDYVYEDYYEIEIKLVDNKATEETIIINNDLKKGNININKYNDSFEPLNDTKFEIYNNNFKVIMTTNNLGKAELNDIPVGDYYIKEIQASEGYQILKDIIPIKLKNNNETITVNIINKKIKIKIPNTNINVEKVILYYRRKNWKLI